MFLSTREQQLLKEFMAQDEPVTIDRMMNLLQVSKRTVYRELSNLEDSLAGINASLEKVSRGRFQVIADQKAQQAIKEALSDKTLELSTTQRQHGIILELLGSHKPLSMQHFLDRYLISNTTFFADIKQLESQLERLPLRIGRNNGYEIIGPEKHRRLLMANILVEEINEYLFFHLNEKEKASHFFFPFVDLEHLLLAQKLLGNVLEPEFRVLSDRKLQFLMLMLTLSMDRVACGEVVLEEGAPSQINRDLLKVAKEVFTRVAAETKQLYAVSEIVFFATLLGDFANSFDEDFFDENFDTKLAYQVKQLIEIISVECEVNFFEDDNLYKMLLTHLSGTLTRAILQEENLNNPILERILAQYPEIASGIRNSLPQIFPSLQFSQAEIAYMVLHFANSLERNPKVMAVDIAGVSPSGLASTSMLEMRLRKYFPFINEITFYRVADLERYDLASKYDLIISTALLPGYPSKYLLVSPLLTDGELNQLKEEFKVINNGKRQGKSSVSALDEDRYGEVMLLIREIDGLLERFKLEKLFNEKDMKKTVEQAVVSFSSSLIANGQPVTEKLLARYHQAPIGIPNTRFGLFHASCEEVQNPCFRIFDLSESLEIEGMDKQPMTLSRMLVMLAPEPISETAAKILGKISGAIIMNDLNTEIFNSGNEAIILQLLSSLLIEEVRN